MASRAQSNPSAAKWSRIQENINAALNRYEQRIPHWRQRSILELVAGAVWNLQEYIARGAADGPTWDKPHVHLNYEVEWDWDAWNDEARAKGGGGLLSG